MVVVDSDVAGCDGLEKRTLQETWHQYTVAICISKYKLYIYDQYYFTGAIYLNYVYQQDLFTCFIQTVRDGCYSLRRVAFTMLVLRPSALADVHRDG